MTAAGSCVYPPSHRSRALPEAEIWLALELQMWEFYVLASVSDEVKPLFLDEPRRDDEEPTT
jgi:hypothetical protein